MPVRFPYFGKHYDIRAPLVPRSMLGASWSHDPEGSDVGHLAREAGISAVIAYNSASRLRHAVENVAYCFKREHGYDFPQFSARESGKPNYRAYLWVSNSALYSHGGAVIGACCFRWRQYREPQSWALQWIWFHPYERRRGHLSKAWPYFIRRHAPFFAERALSEAMTAFLERHPAPWPPAANESPAPQQPNGA